MNKIINCLMVKLDERFSNEIFVMKGKDRGVWKWK